ncbi:MAG: RNA polymerase sigma factor SigI [Bacillota bacterium]
MGFLFRKNAAQEVQTDSGVLIEEAKKGNHWAREELIKNFTPFVLKVTSKVSGRYVRLGEDDEVSIGLMAFNEAIDCYDNTKNMAFLSFAETVMRRRLIDYYRKELPNSRNVPLSTFESDDDDNRESIMYHIEARQSTMVHTEGNLAAERKEEILAYNRELQEYGITFAELVEISPKHEDARLRAMEAAALIAQDRELADYLKRKKELPLKVLSNKVDTSRKTLERQRKYIIAVALILINDYGHLRQYIQKAL